MADADAHSAADAVRDLALVDGRFDADVIEATVRRAVAAWAEAIDGTDEGLVAIATPAVARELLQPSADDRLRLVVRAPAVESTRVVGFDPDATPPTTTVQVAIRAIRYLEDRDTLDLIAGDADDPTRWTGSWTLSLDGAPGTPWRVAHVHDDAPSSPEAQERAT